MEGGPWSGVHGAPEDDANEEGESDDGCVIEGVEQLEDAGQAHVQVGGVREGVLEGVEGGEKEIERYQ